MSMAVPVGDNQVVVQHQDDSMETFGRFATRADAFDWAMSNRSSLGLARSKDWWIEKVVAP